MWGAPLLLQLAEMNAERMQLVSYTITYTHVVSGTVSSPVKVDLRANNIARSLSVLFLRAVAGVNLQIKRLSFFILFAYP